MKSYIENIDTKKFELELEKSILKFLFCFSKLEESEKLLAEQLNNHKKLLDKKTNLINQKLIKENIVNSLDMQIPSKDRIIYLNSVK